MRQTALLLAGIIAAGATIRVFGLGATPLWIDETMSLILAEYDYVVLWLTPVDPSPGMYYSLHKLLFDGTVPSAFQARLPSAVIGTAAIAVMFALGKATGGPRMGLVAAGLLAVHAYHVIYSQEVRSYSLVFLWVSLSAYCLTRALAAGQDGTGEATHRERWQAGYVLFAVLALYTHYSSIFWLSFSFAALVLYELALAPARQRWSLLRQHVTLGVLLALCVAPAAAMVSFLSGLSGWIQHFTFGEFLINLRRVFAFPELDFPVLDLLLLVLVMSGLVIAWRQRSPAAPAVTALLLMPPVMWLIGFVKPVLIERSIVPVSIGIILCSAVALQAIPRRSLRIAAGVFLLVLSGLNTAIFLHEDRKGNRNHDWRGAADRLLDQVQPGEAIFLCREWIYPPLRHAMGPAMDRIPTYSMVYQSGEIYRLDQVENPAPRWTATFSRLPWREEGGYRKVDAGELAKYLVIWGIRQHCATGDKVNYDATITKLDGSANQIWTGYTETKVIPGSGPSDWRDFSIKIDRITPGKQAETQ